jgi:hypothetical protein
MSKKFVGLIVLVSVLGLAQASLAAWDPGTDPSLLGWWKCDEGQGNVVGDSSPNGRNGTFVNGNPAWTTGFRGSGSGIRLVGPTLVEIPAKSMTLTQATMAGWLLPNGTQPDWASIIMHRSPGPASGFNLLADRHLAYHWNDAADTWGYRGNAYYAADEWTHCAVTVEPTKATFYVNGVSASVNTVAHGSALWDGPIYLGGDGTSGFVGRRMNGSLDDVMFFSRALTAAEIRSLVPPQLKARKPSPANGATGVMIPLLGWTPGETAVSEDVYIGTAPELTAANRVIRQPAAFKMFYAATLAPGQKYYWRVDAVDAKQKVTTGDVWSFTMAPVTAYNPVPADGAKYQGVNVDLAWTPGLNANKHEVYFSTNKDDVANAAAAASKGSLLLSTLELDPLVLDTTYYWRVDEIDAMGNKKDGSVWSFTTRPLIAKTANLVGWWKLEDENSGTAVDYSGWDNNGTLLGNPKWVDGAQGGALEFDGMDDAVDTGYVTDLATWTVCTWVISPQPPAATAATGPVHREKNFQIDWNHGTAEFRGAAAMCIGGTWYSASFGNLLGDTWYHLTATYDGKQLLTYVNGELMATNTGPEGPTDAEMGTLTFGKHSTAAQFFAGSVDDIRLYDRALTQDEVKQAMRGDPLLAWDPRPMSGFMVDIRDAGTLTWSSGETAAKHDVYVGKDKAAVKDADTSSPDYRGRQTGTSFSTAGAVEFGGGAYFWRVDEVEADGTTIHKGNVWSFTVPAYLLVDDFESYTDEVTGRIFQTWIDGWGYTEPEPGNPGNGTGATVGYIDPPFAERTIIKNGRQSMPFGYDNSVQPYYSETERTWDSPQNWTVSGVDTLSLQVRGYPALTSMAVTETGGKMTLTGAGSDIWNNSDDFTYAYKSLNGDGTIVARVANIGTGTNTWAKGGVMIRDSIDGGSMHAMMVMTANSDGTAGNGASFQYRAATDGASAAADSTGVVAPPYWVKLERFGDTLSGYVSPDGSSWTIVGTTDVVMTDPVYVGICVTSHAATEQRTVQFEGIKTTGSVTGAWQGAEIKSPRYNSVQDFYVAVQDSANKVAVVKDTTAVNSAGWVEVQMPLSSFAGVNMTKVKKMFIGVGNRNAPVADGSGMLFIDDIRVIKPAPAGQ